MAKYTTVEKISVKPYIKRAKLSGIFTDAEIGRYIVTALRSACELIRDYAREHHRYEDHTGKLTQGIKYNVSKGTRAKNMSLWTGKVGYIDKNSTPHYAKYQIGGTKAHGPRHSKYLRFVGIKAPWTGRVFFKKWVRGIKRDSYIRNAYAQNKEEIRNIFEETLEDMIYEKRKSNWVQSILSQY